jgi:hypothetical protein
MVQTQAIWSKTKTGGKAGFDKLWTWADKLGAPVNRLSNKLGSEVWAVADILGREGTLLTESRHFGPRLWTRSVSCARCGVT